MLFLANRLKNFGFKERSFVLELPKPLLLQDVALRLLYPPYDTLSPQSRSFAPNVSLVLQDNVAVGKDTNVPTSGDIQPTAAQGKVEGVGENSIPGQEKVSSGPSQEEGSSGVTNGDNSIAIKVWTGRRCRGRRQRVKKNIGGGGGKDEWEELEGCMWMHAKLVVQSRSMQHGSKSARSRPKASSAKRGSSKKSAKQSGRKKRSHRSTSCEVR